jgi:hypothetical protein
MAAPVQLLHVGLSSMRRWAVGGLVLTALLGVGACRKQRFPSRGDAAAVVVVAPRRDAASPPKVSEQEPNDTPASAQPLSLGASTRLAVTLEGELSPKDVDLFKLVVPGERLEPAKEADVVDAGAVPDDPRLHARRLSLEIAPEGSGLSLQLLDDAGKALAGISADAGTVSGMPNLAVMPGGTYLVRVKPPAKPGKVSQPSTCRYRLTAQLGDFEVADEREPNDSKETATPVVVVGTVELAGYLGWSRDQDFYRVPLPEVASALDVELDALDNVGASLQVVDASGARLGLAKGPRGERLALRNVILQPPEADAPSSALHAYVVVRAETGQNRDRRYVLRLTLGSPKMDAEVEPNDSPEKATPVKDGTYSGYLSAGDSDFFRYDGEGRQSVTFAVSFPRRVRGKLEAFGSGKLPAGTAESKKSRQLVSLTNVQTLGQPILLRVSGLRGDGNANEPYTLRVSSAPASPTHPLTP